MLPMLHTLDALARARHEKDFYNIALQLIRFAAPLEISALVSNGSIKYEPFRDWLAKLHADLIQDNSRVTKFKHDRISDALSFYTNGTSPADKILIVGFCTRTHDLCAPTSLVLQYFPETDHDVLVLRDVKAVGFTAGIPTYASPLATAVERLRMDFRIDDYRGIRCFGVSSGGAAALLAGRILEAERAISICGRLPTALECGETREAIELESALSHSPSRPGQIAAVYPAGHRVDAANARRMARAIDDLILIPVPNLSDHSILKPLLRRGELAGFFRSIGLTSS